MAEEAMLRKLLHRQETEMDTSGEAGDFGTLLAARPQTPDNDRAFLPDMEAIESETTNLLTVNDAAGTSGLVGYKINVPGFIYVQHWRGNWDPAGFIQVLVSSSSSFSSCFELMNTNGSGNDHVNNMFPIRPGSSTHIVLRGNIQTYGSTANFQKSVYFIPAWNTTMQIDTVYKRRVSNGISAITRETGISVGTVKGSPSNASDKDAFFACFR